MTAAVPTVIFFAEPLEGIDPYQNKKVVKWEFF